MKHLKISMLALLAIVLGIAGSAFSVHESSHLVTKNLSGPFYYSYNLTTDAGKHVASNYSFIDPQPQDPGDEGCQGSGIPCVILATGTSGTMGLPDASQVNSVNLPSTTKVQKSAQ